MLAPPPIPTPAHTREKVKHACLWLFVLSTFVYQVSPEEIIYYTTFSLHYILPLVNSINYVF